MLKYRIYYINNDHYCKILLQSHKWYGWRTFKCILCDLADSDYEEKLNNAHKIINLLNE